MSVKDLGEQFDKIFAEMGEKSDEDFNRAVEEIMKNHKTTPLVEIDEENAETAEDFLDLCDSAKSKKQALKYAKKALELEPENIDAQIIVANLSSDSAEVLLKKYKKLIAQANEKMEADGWFSDEYMGRFWGLWETRPYMRLRAEYVDLLINCSMLGLAVNECKDLLRLSESDNLGMRYRLMHLFVHFEDEKSALGLLDEYDEQSTMFLLPLSILYYRLGNLSAANKYLQKLRAVNEDTEDFFKAFAEDEWGDYADGMSGFGYRPFTVEEFIVEIQENSYLFSSAHQYFNWAVKKLR